MWWLKRPSLFKLTQGMVWSTWVTRGSLPCVLSLSAEAMGAFALHSRQWEESLSRVQTEIGLPWWEAGKWPSQVHVLIPGVCAHILTQQKKLCRCNGDECPGLTSRALNVTPVSSQVKQGDLSSGEEKARWQTTEAKTETMPPPARESRQPPEAGRCKEWVLPCCL